MELNFLNLSSQTLLFIVIFIMIIKLIGIFVNYEQFTSNVDYDKYQAAYNQEQDNVLGATTAGNALNKKVVSAWSSEGLTGGYESPEMWNAAEHSLEQSKSDGGVVVSSRPVERETMEDPLEAVFN